MFGSALWSRYNNDTPEMFGAGDGTMSPQMAELEALLKTKHKKQEWEEKRAAHLAQIKATEGTKDHVILEELAERPGLKEIRLTPTLLKSENGEDNEEGYI
jgi:hypothetical protein